MALIFKFYNHSLPSPCTVTIYQAFSAEFGFLKPKANPPQPARLSLTVDLRAKLLRSSSVLDQLYDGRDPNTHQLSKQDQDRAGRIWTGETVIYKCDKRTYSIVGFKFDHSATSLPVEGLLINGKPCSHAQYFKERKNINLQYPNAKPMVICLGRRKEKIFLPAELICGNELDPQVKAQLPIIASYSPSERNQAIESIRNFLKPGAQKTKGRSGLLPAVGISLQEDRYVMQTLLFLVFLLALLDWYAHCLTINYMHCFVDYPPEPRCCQCLSLWQLVLLFLLPSLRIGHLYFPRRTSMCPRTALPDSML